MKICKYLNEIQFVTNRITPCFTTLWEKEGYVEKYFIKADINTSPEIFNSFFDLRKKYRQMYIDGNIPEFCQNCYYYQPEEDEEKNRSDNPAFTVLYVLHRNTCHCKCVYCCLAGENNTEKDFIEMNNAKYYDIKPIFQYLDEHKLIDETTTIVLAGGECTEYPEESHYLIDVGIKNSCSFKILTNGIIYDEYIANLMKNYTTDIVVSLDSGSKDMYKKVKRVNAFDRIIENISKYSMAGKENPNARMMLKYIFCPGINDKKDEVKKFKKIAENINAFCVILSIDRYWQSKNIDKPVPKRLQEAMNYFMSRKDFPDIASTIDYGFVNKDWADKVITQ